jgi:glucosamine--fructose-6-phosphate aminotransferase (isomerizing)
MCGIVGYTGSKDSIAIVFDGLKRLEYRGYDSSGIAISNSSDIIVHKSTGRVAELEQKFNPECGKNSKASIGHTRWASHGDVSHKNAHPHSSKMVTIVHNGVIDNADELKNKLEKTGYEFVSDTDSEVIAHLIDSFYNINPFEAMEQATALLKGTYGIAVLFKDLPGMIGLAKNGSPLVIGIGKDKDFFVASDTNALIQYTDSFIYMEDGDIAVVNPNCDIRLNNRRSIKKIDDSDAYIELGSHKDFMIKEIHEQPDAISRCFSSRILTSTCNLSGFNLSNNKLSSITSVTIIGCGTSYHAGLVAKNYIEKWARVPCHVEIASEFSNKKLIIDRSGIYIAISQSGETFDTIECIKEINKKGMNVYGIVNTVGSTIARMCGAGAYTHTGPEISVASTKAFTTQLSALLMFSAMLGRSKEMSFAEGYKFSSELKELPSMLKVLISRMEKADFIIRDSIAKTVSEAKYVLFLGRGVLYPIAMEGALKLKEIAYIPCESYAGGEMKHGPIAMIEKGTPVICLIANDEHKEKMLTNISEVKARGATIITVSNWDKKIKDIADYNWSVPTIAPNLVPFFMVTVLQMIAYHCASILGNDIDKPRNLCKTITIG